jgi:hypothetical protein
LERDADVYVPLAQGDPMVLNNRATHAIHSIGRLRVGVTASQAQAEMTAIQNGLDQLYPEDNRDLGIYIEPLKQEIVGDVGETLLLLLGAVGLVLLIACANVASLVLARSASRAQRKHQRECSRPALYVGSVDYRWHSVWSRPGLEKLER